MRNVLLAVASMLVMVSCRDGVKACVSGELPPIWPDYTFVTVPVNIAPLDFGMADGVESSRMKVALFDRNGTEVLSSTGKTARFPVKKWHKALASSSGGSLRCEVSAKVDGKWIAYAPFDINVSRDSIDYGLTYRMIPPGYQSFGHMGLYERRLSDFRQRTLVDSRMIESGCVNCHTANRADPDWHSIHVRGKHSATLMHTNGLDECLNTATDSTGGFFVYPYWHPSGKYIAYSVNKTRQSFYSSADRTLEVYDENSDVIVYCPESHKILRPSLTNIKDKFETMPAFSADGKTLYFSVANAGELPKDAMRMKYSLCSLAFDPETGRFGDHVDTLVSASRTNRTHVSVKPSYDGNFLLVTVADYGTFLIDHPEADLWLYDLRTGEYYPAGGINSGNTESFHNWSTNSRWAVVSSRRDDGLYTRLYIAHFNPETKLFDKAFLLPQRNPGSYYLELPDSYNTPDFTVESVSLSVRNARRLLLSDERTSVSLSDDN